MADTREVVRAISLDRVPHGFLTGIGHAGEPDPAVIAPGLSLVRVKQVHSPRVVIAERALPEAERPEADAIVTDRPGLLLAIVTADCAPVLLADCEAGIVAAAHAGWRGAFDGVLEATVEAMVRLGAEPARIAAVIGPTIAQASYEVDQAFHDRLVDHDAANAGLFEPGRAGHFQFDLPAYVARRLRTGAGVERIEDLSLDTYAEEARFHSFRRATHRGEPTYGRQFSLIALPD